MTQLEERAAGRRFDVEQRQASADQLKAQLAGAKWNLDKTVVRAPADGYVTNLALRKGARVANLPLTPVMAFIDTADTLIGVEIAQIDARYIAVGQPVEVIFKFMPGTVYSGKVEAVLQAIGSGQVQTSGVAVMPTRDERIHVTSALLTKAATLLPCNRLWVHDLEYYSASMSGGS